MILTEEEDSIFVHDFVAINSGIGIELAKQMVNISKFKNKPLDAFVSIHNFQLINLMIKRYDFRIVDIYNGKYLLERNIKRGV